MNLLILCDAASTLEKRAVSTLGKQDAFTSRKRSPAAKGTHGKSNERELFWKFEETYQAKAKFPANMDFKSHTPKISNHLFAEYIENTSDELRKRFSYKCRFSPDTCSEVVESYGSEVKAFSKMKQHLWNHLQYRSPRPLDETSKFSPKSSKRSCSVKTLKTISEGGSNRGKSILQKPTEKKESVHVTSDTHFEVDGGKDFNVSMDTLKFGQFDHDYAKSEDMPSTTNPPVQEVGQDKNQRGKFDVAHSKWTLRELSKHINGDSYIMPPIIHTAPFPFVHTPEPLELASVVELHSNGDPVVSIEPIFFQSSASRISSLKAVENKVTRKKSKFARIINAPRSVLECVENRVAGKPCASSEQRDAPVPDNSIENSENVEKSVHEIAWRNIRILSQQRRKRKYRDKPSVYICEICNKHFTANTSLTYHYLGHLKIKPFKCHICCRTFTRRHSLKYHMMIHANKNRFQCSTCKRLFRHPSHYKEHLRKHTGEEPYSCKFCSNKFKTRNSFKRHLKMQHQKLLTSKGIVPIQNDS